MGNIKLDMLVNWPLWISVTIAALTVFLLLFGRYEIRLRRLRMIRDYMRAFPQTAGDPDVHIALNPSFEFVRTKYSADVEIEGGLADGTPQQVIAEINRVIAATRIFGNRGDLRILIASIGYLLVVAAGFYVALSSHSCPDKSLPCAGEPMLSLFLIGGLPGAVDVKSNPSLLWMALNTATVAGFVFVGAYVASLRYLVRALSIFDLSAYTFVRQTAMIVISVLVTVILYRALPNPIIAIASLADGKPPALPVENPGIPLVWMLLALAFGLLPESAIQFALVKTSSILTWIQSTDDRFFEWTRVVPLDVIDGIDYFTRFRLEECGISEVQALATYNPIMLHIETPYGIYQAIDWIAQAQLCCVVGLDRFLLLRQFNIRTIFDLERSLHQDRAMTPTDAAAVDKFDLIYAGILFSPNNALRGIQKISDTRFLIDEDGKIVEVDGEKFTIWARQQINSSPAAASKAIEHLMSWIGDDLHVRRARRLWNEISMRLGPSSLKLLTDTEILNARKPA
jgi:hypothetical protein